MKYFILLYSFFGLFAYATETDSWTCRSVPLKDSSQTLNSLFNNILNQAVTITNTQIGSKMSDTEVEFLFSNAYFSKAFKNNLKEDTMGEFERCIDRGDCEGEWQKIERINIKKDQSVFYEANYSSMTKKFLATQLEACGVRFGSDKLTHMFNDGFRFFNKSRQDASFNQNNIKDYSLLLEYRMMGADLTGVISHSDVEANFAGFQLFSDIISKHLVRDSQTQLLKLRPVDLCHYIKPVFDEAVLENEYPRKNALKLKESISKRANYTNCVASELLSKDTEINDVSALDMVKSIKTMRGLIFESKVRKAFSPFRTKPDQLLRMPFEFVKD